MSSVFVYVGDYVATPGVGDDTVGIQAAIDAAPPGATVLFDMGAEYVLTSVQITRKSLTLDLNGATYRVDPYGTDHAAFEFEGTRYGAIALTGPAARGASAVTTVAPPGLYAGDWVVVSDNRSVPTWDGAAVAYEGQSEVTQVMAVNGTTVTLAKPLEYDYTTAPLTIAKIDMLDSPVLKGSGARFTEVDHGDGGASAREDIVGFFYCLNNLAEGFTVDGWNRIGAHSHYCVGARHRRITARKPLRPNEGGHGYLSRFSRSVRGLLEDSVGEGCRHVSDYVATVDCGSARNLSIAPVGVSYLTHGYESWRTTSTDDAVYAGDSADIPGWGHGNSSFAVDRGFTIVRPVAVGGYEAVRASAGSGPTVVRDADLHVRQRGITAYGLAHDLTVQGGTIEITDPVGARYSVYSSGRFNAARTAAQPVRNVSVRDVTLIGQFAQVAIEGTEGTVVVAGNRGRPSVALKASMIAVTPGDTGAMPEDVFIRGNFVEPTFDRGINVTAAPTNSLHVEENWFKGTTVAALALVSTATLIGRVARNTSDSAGGAGFTITGPTDLLDVSDNCPDDSCGKFARPLVIGDRSMWVDADGRWRSMVGRPASEFEGSPLNSAMPRNVQAVAYQLALNDTGKAVDVSSPLPAVVTVPAATSVNFALGATVEVCRWGSGSVSIVGGVGVTIRSAIGNQISAQFASVRLRKVAANEWVLS